MEDPLDRVVSGSPLLNMLYRAAFDTLLPLFLFGSIKFERRENCFSVADDVMGTFLTLRPKYLETIRGNVAQVLGIPANSQEAELLARRVARQFAYSWVDFFRFGQRPLCETLDNFETLVGDHHVREVVDSGKGAIFLTAHGGNYELGALLLKKMGLWLKMHIVYKPSRFSMAERIRDYLRQQCGVVGVPVDGLGYSTIQLLKLIREGHAVGMQGDRDFSHNGIAIPFFGREAFFPRGPWELAALTGCPVIATFFYMDDEMRFGAHFDPPIHIDGARRAREASIKGAMLHYVSTLEDLVRRHPDQWYCFYPFWDDPVRKNSTDGQ